MKDNNNNNNNIIFNLQLDFRQHYSTLHALINITENIRKAPHEGNIGSGDFVDIQKPLINALCTFYSLRHRFLKKKYLHP